MDLLINVERPGERELRAPPPTTLGSRPASASRRRASASDCACGHRRRVQRRDGRPAGAVATSAWRRRPTGRWLGRTPSGALSARGRHRVVRVAQTIADLEDHARVTEADVLTALSLRQRSAAESALAA